MGLHLRAAQELHLISPGGASCPRSYQPVGGEGSEPASSFQALASLTRPSPPRAPGCTESCRAHGGARDPGVLLTHCTHGSTRQHLPSPFRPYLLPIGNVGTIQLCRLYEHINIPEAGKTQRVQAGSGTQEDTPPNAIPLFPTPPWRTIEQLSASVPICWLCLCVRLGGPHISYLGMFWFSGAQIPASSACVACGQD